MMILILTFSLIYFVLWACFKLLGLVLEVALFPVKFIFGVAFAIIGYVVFPALLFFFMVPVIAILISWIISKIICPI